MQERPRCANYIVNDQKKGHITPTALSVIKTQERSHSTNYYIVNDPNRGREFGGVARTLGPEILMLFFFFRNFHSKHAQMLFFSLGTWNQNRRKAT